MSFVLDDSVQLSFFGYKHKLLNPCIKTEYFNIASVEDIACMKLSAVTSRSLEKDYVDLYFIFKNHSLEDILKIFVQKYPTLDVGVVLKSLVFFGRNSKRIPVFIILAK